MIGPQLVRSYLHSFDDDGLGLLRQTERARGFGQCVQQTGAKQRLSQKPVIDCGVRSFEDTVLKHVRGERGEIDACQQGPRLIFGHAVRNGPLHQHVPQTNAHGLDVDATQL